MPGTKFRGSAVFTVLLYAPPEWRHVWQSGGSPERGGGGAADHRGHWPWATPRHRPGLGLATSRTVRVRGKQRGQLWLTPSSLPSYFSLYILYCRTPCLCHFDIITRKNSNIIICSFTRNHNQQEDYKTQLCLAFVINTFSRPNEYEHFKTSVPCVYQWQKTDRKTWRERGGREGEERNGERRK